MKPKNFALFIFIVLLLVACNPSEQANTAALDITQTAQPTITNTPEPTAMLELTPTATPEPTATNTPEFCNPDECTTAFEEITFFYNGAIEQMEVLAQITDGDLGSASVELTKLQRELELLYVPECMTYLKQTLYDSISSGVSASIFLQAGAYNEVVISLAEADTYMRLFIDEIESLMDSFPNCLQ